MKLDTEPRILVTTAIWNDDQELFLAHRFQPEKDLNQWELPGGKFQYTDRDRLFTAQREGFEEWGIHLQIGELLLERSFTQRGKAYDGEVYEAKILDGRLSREEIDVYTDESRFVSKFRARRLKWYDKLSTPLTRDFVTLWLDGEVGPSL